MSSGTNPPRDTRAARAEYGGKRRAGREKVKKKGRTGTKTFCAEMHSRNKLNKHKRYATLFAAVAILARMAQAPQTPGSTGPNDGPDGAIRECSGDNIQWIKERLVGRVL
ncbi:uncharacterized protein SPSK_06766 [Sporothrix schenckii 1099-18]|uniref:Uncharacterized protein n=1 Tax=Sporothrix schenckii 1099-18 TaxID=1397361 RepID=A0A0F2MNM1_SPOSC|nr:uncharacterized protein SPSK_06766 [Sporothrix schenckii 1099-18]KJR89786.1 hypothetical protein SPSK_06766 [Sporothrix schenckii 1099-18]